MSWRVNSASLTLYFTSVFRSISFIQTSGWSILPSPNSEDDNSWSEDRSYFPPKAYNLMEACLKNKYKST